MGYIEEIRRASGNELTFALTFISGGVCPGLLSIWCYDPSLVEKSGVVIFLLLGIAISLPLTCINAFVVLFLNPDQEEKIKVNEKGPAAIAFGSVLTLIAIGVPLLLCFLGHVSVKIFVADIAVAEGFLIGCLIYNLFFEKKKNQTEPQSDSAGKAANS